MDSGTTNYELAYLLSPSLSEEEVLAWTEKLASLIQDTKGIIRHQESIQKRKLAYRVKKEHNAYFGWTTFSMPKETLKAFEKKIAGTNNMLRHLLVNEVEIKQQLFRISTPRVSLPRPTHVPPPAGEQSEEKLDLEELDKRLEEILGK